MESSVAAIRFELCSSISCKNIGAVNVPPSRRKFHNPQRWLNSEDSWHLGRISFRNSNRSIVVDRIRRSDERLRPLRRKSRVSAVDSEIIHAAVDEAIVLKNKAEDLAPYLSDRCIYLIGMMGSGKSTVGKILAKALGYSFYDSDKLVEQAVGGTSVAQIFKQYSEAFFRDNETEVLRDLSTMRRLVVATGGGAVIRPINWSYMKKGITVWLDVPLEALASRIAAVGTDSRPLLHHESGDPYTQAYVRLSNLFRERADAYANADIRLSLDYVATKRGLGDVSSLTPTAIADEAIEGMKIFMKKTPMQGRLKDDQP
ncbi:shikimate kinase 3, chloroplastic-like isoform X2 [Wolffia australiana]